MLFFLIFKDLNGEGSNFFIVTKQLDFVFFIFVKAFFKSFLFMKIEVG